jgi:protein SCO1
VVLHASCKGIGSMTFAKLALPMALIAAMGVESAAHEISRDLAGPADHYVYQLAAPGTYQLPVIKPAMGGIVLDDRGARHELRELLTGQFTILAFVYTRCGDLCPLATMRLAQLRELAGQSYRGKLRLITMSFDPDYDTPETMSAFAEAWRGPDAKGQIPWLFLTAPSRESIEPMLAAYNQPLAPKLNSSNKLGSISHLMRVFLIDDKARIRNIYSPDFLDPRLLLNDLRTLEFYGSTAVR